MESKIDRVRVIQVTWDATGTVATFTIKGCAPLVFDTKKAHPDNGPRATRLGWKQRISNAAALEHNKADGKAIDPSVKRDAMARLVEHFESGNASWSPTREAAAPSLDPLIIQAVMTAMGWDEEAVRAYVTKKATEHKTPEVAYLARLGQAKKVAPILDGLRAAAASGIDPDEELGE